MKTSIPFSMFAEVFSYPADPDVRKRYAVTCNNYIVRLRQLIAIEETRVSSEANRLAGFV